MSMPMIAVTGAERVLATLPGETHSSSFALASGEMTKAIRAGELLAEVGAHFIRSKSWRSSSSDTGSAVKPLWVRASSKSCSVVMFMRCAGGPAREAMPAFCASPRSPR